MNGEIRCPKCKGDKFSYAGENAFKCAYCGTVFQLPKPEPAPQSAAPQPQQEKPIVVNVQMPHNQGYQPQSAYQQRPVYRSYKSKSTAGVLAILLAGWGIHWLYLGRTGKGLFYLITWLLLCWTFVVPIIFAIINIIEGIYLLCMNQQEFNEKYNS